MNWFLLIIAGLFEVAFAACLEKAKHASENESIYWYVGFLVCLSISMVLLVKATQELPIGTAYAVWTGIGAVGTVLQQTIIMRLLIVLMIRDTSNLLLFFLVVMEN